MSDEPAPKNHFSIQKIYVKDVSFESPATPKVFSFQKWEPKIDLNLSNRHTKVASDMYEAVLSITATVSQEDQTAFLIEVQQAGLFAVSGFNDQESSYLLGSQCMNILFPYAREVISDLTVRGGFPPVILSPVNFDALYQQHLKSQNEKQASETQDESSESEQVKH
ncbi:MAG: protein-export chaperone SecB [Gammaproteobacteria bacterium]|nr:protein-export chaperone SecB [Gammaproteobacteria bacterium]